MNGDKVKKDKSAPLVEGGKKAVKQYILSLEVGKLEFEVREAERLDELSELNHRTTVAHESFTGVFRLYGDVEGGSMERLRIVTARYAAAYPKAPITLIISSPGGSIYDGWVLFDHLRALSADGHKITTVVRGMAASMAAVLAQAGDVRVIGPESYLVIHEAATEAWGKASDVAEQVDMLKRLCRQAEGVFARRSKLSAKEIKARTYKKDWYVNAKESKALGFADKIG